MTKYIGKCYCDKIELEVTGDPETMMLCHCKGCRAWNAVPVSGVSLWKPENVKITKGSESVKSITKVKGFKRTFCKECGGHIFNDHSETLGVINVYCSILENFNFKPVAHLNYESTILPIKDGLPKFNDFPEDIGGSGKIIEE